jgi:hypothetical protein
MVAATPTADSAVWIHKIDVLHAVAATLTPVELVAATPTIVRRLFVWIHVLVLHGSSYADAS